jgi:hypothetical protein
MTIPDTGQRKKDVPRENVKDGAIPASLRHQFNDSWDVGLTCFQANVRRDQDSDLGGPNS